MTALPTPEDLDASTARLHAQRERLRDAQERARTMLELAINVGLGLAASQVAANLEGDPRKAADLALFLARAALDHAVRTHIGG